MSQQAGVYVRISSDPEGKRLGVTRQLKDCRKKAGAMGWKVAEVYEDNDTSASNGKPRPAYERMIADLEAGKIGAVVVWDLDRLHRRPIELEHFIDLADRRKVALASVGGDVDLATDNGRMFARIKGAVARAEVERKSERQVRANQQKAEDGEPWIAGGRCFGYEQDGRTIVPHEAEAIRHAADAFLAGASLKSIARDLMARGVKTASGGTRWHNTNVRNMLANPRYAALRVHRGEIVGPGNWPPIIEEETHYAVKAVLSNHRPPGPPRRYLLSGVARCAVCDGSIFGQARGDVPVYRCRNHHIARRAEEIEAYIEQVVIERLARPDAADLFARDDRAEEVTALRQEEAALRSRLDQLAEAFAAGEISRRQLTAGTKKIEARVEEIDRALAAATRSPVLSEIVTAEDVAAVWETLDLDRKRAVITTLMEIKIQSPGKGARTFDPATVGITWKSGP